VYKIVENLNSREV